MITNINAGATYNAAQDLIGRNLDSGRADKIAVIDANGSYSYREFDRQARQFANVLNDLGVQREQRIVICIHDTVMFPVCFFGSILAGIIPIPINTRLVDRDYEYILSDSQARALVLSSDLLGAFEGHLDSHLNLGHVIIVGDKPEVGPHLAIANLMAGASVEFQTVNTILDDICFWLYTSGTTGMPKGVVHLHSHLIQTANLYAIPTLKINAGDVVFSAAKLFFAYGLGNALTFPFAVGATTVLLEGPPTPVAVAKIFREHELSIFFGVPTLFATLLTSNELPPEREVNLRLCVSAGEALPGELLARWQKRMGCDVLDGLGSTEMLHIFLSNREGDVRPNCSGLPVSGYELRVVDEKGQEVPVGELGNLHVSGPTSAIMYWNQRDKSRDTFQGRWTVTGDKYYIDQDGYYIYGGRSDDMLKVGGIYVSPFEVEAALIAHNAVLEAAVVGCPDTDNLIKPKAFVVLNDTYEPSDLLANELQVFVRKTLAEYKYPRWIKFLDDLPKTATGKIQRYRLRGSI